MIIPINMVVGGIEKEVGTARLVELDGEITVEYYLMPGFVLSGKAQSELTASLKKLFQKSVV